MDKRLIYLGGRGTGKTKRMIDEAAKHPNSVIVVASFGSKISLEARLQNEGKNYIKVMTINEMVSSYWGKLVGMRDYKFFFDDVQNCLRTLINHYHSGVIGGMSINFEPVIDEVRLDYDHHNDYMDCLRFEKTKEEKKMPPKDGNTGTFYFDNLPITIKNGHGIQKGPHIDHVIFNGPATIVFWKDRTKTVVKHDGKGRKDKRQAVLYAFIRKIYGEGRPYHNILNEIEEAIK